MRKKPYLETNNGNKMISELLTLEVEDIVGLHQAGAKEPLSIMKNSRNRDYETIVSAEETLDKTTSITSTIDQLNAQITNASIQQSNNQRLLSRINQSIIISQVVKRTALGVQGFFINPSTFRDCESTSKGYQHV